MRQAILQASGDPSLGKGRRWLLESKREATCEVPILNDEGLHARPVMKFVDLASNYSSEVSVVNVTRNGEVVDGKSAMQMMLLEATRGNVLRIRALGEDAQKAVESLEALIKARFDLGAQDD